MTMRAHTRSTAPCRALTRAQLPRPPAVRRISLVAHADTAPADRPTSLSAHLPSLSLPHPRPPAAPRTPGPHRTRTTLYSPGKDEVYPDVWGLRGATRAHADGMGGSDRPSAAATDHADPFWRAFRSHAQGSGRVVPASPLAMLTAQVATPANAFSRHRTHTRAAVAMLGGGRGEGGANSAARGQAHELAAPGTTAGGAHKSALIFAGLGSYPHLPTSPTPASRLIWQRASAALLAPNPAIGYYPSAELLNEFGPAAGGGPAGGEGEGSAWLRGWMAGGRTLKDLMRRPDLTSAFVLTSSVAVLASAQESTHSRSLLPASTTRILGHGFVGTLTCLVVAGKLALEDAVRLCRLYALLPPAPAACVDERAAGPGANAGFMTTLLTLSSDPSRTRRYSLSEPAPESEGASGPASARKHAAAASRSSGSDPEPLDRVLRIIHELQVAEGWNENLMDEDGAEDGLVGEEADSAEALAPPAREWAGEAMINSRSMVVVSGTKGAVIKIIDRLRASGLATPVMDLYMPAPYHTPLMRHAIHQFRDHLKGCMFYPEGGAPPAGWLDQGVEPKVEILDGMTCQPLDLSDIPSALVAHLTRPLQWADTTRLLWSQFAGADAPELAIRTVGKGTRGLGMMIEKEIRAATAAGGGAGTKARGGTPHAHVEALEYKSIQSLRASPDVKEPPRVVELGVRG